MSDIYIPPEHLRFRLLGYVSQNVLFSRTSQEPQVGHCPVGQERDDQYFTLIHGTGKRSGLYALKSPATDKVLFSRTNAEPCVWHISGNGRWDDSWFKLEPGKGQYSKQFRLYSPFSDTVVFSRTEWPYIGNISAADVYADQYFSFVFEDMSVDRIEYDFQLGTVVSSASQILATQVIDNELDVEHETRFELSETVTHTSTFYHASGLPPTDIMSVQGGVPVINDGDIRLDDSAQERTLNESSTFHKTYTASFTVTIGPHSTTRVVWSINKGIIEVPYTVYLSSRRAGVKAETKGIWRGASTWDLRHTSTMSVFNEPSLSNGRSA
ncbi:hemolytic lectin [Artomyces pyxidatus]|uniref:Hemolytic lectin n=1 Tax=Artomyces pyxidatus TaxID=48021 RepID=A0ACB8TGK2_9AGAM|nr:hemolytic lectin [Artomyces pyxidatus]